MDVSKENVGATFAVSPGSMEAVTSSLSSSPSKPPVGSRLVQYMQPQQRKQSTTPVMSATTSGVTSFVTTQNGPSSSFEPSTISGGGKDYLSTTGGFVSSSPMNLGPSTSHTSIFHPNHPSVSPPSHTFSQMNVSPHNNEFIPGKMMHSVSNPVFVPEGQHQASFTTVSGPFMPNPRDTVTPPGRRRIQKSPIMSEAALSNSSSFLQESIGGTTYFYNTDESQTPSAVPLFRTPEFRMHHAPPQALLPNFYSYNAVPSHLAHLRPKGAGIASFFTPNELKMELLERQMLSMAQADPEQYPDLPQDVDAYSQLVPLEPIPKTPLAEHMGFFMHYLCSTYKAISNKDGLVYCLRRLYTMVFVYDYYPGAETLKYRHFSGMSKANGLTHALFEEFDSHRIRFGHQSQLPGKFMMNGMSTGSSCGIPESLIWSYVVQLSSALRAIHAAGLAARTMEPSKILVVGRAKYLLSQTPGRVRNINDIMPMIGARFYAQLEGAQVRIDLLENELAKEVENGRLFRLLCKLGTVNERPEYNMDPSWSETGDRYLLKLFRDYLFHQVTDDGRPWIDMAHVVHCLNKVDAGTQEKLSLVSRDEQNVLVVSYADLKRCMEQAFQELLSGSTMIPTSQ